MEQRDEHTRAAGADGMPDGDRAAMDVDLRRIEAEFAIDGQRLHAESLVQFEEVDLGEGQSGLRSDLAHGIDGREAEPLRLAAAGGLSADDGHRLEAQFPCPLGAHDNQRCGSVADAGSVACSDRATFFESWLESGKNFHGGFGTDRFVGVEKWVTERSFFCGRNLDGQNLVAECVLALWQRRRDCAIRRRRRPALRG